ncbi:MAG: cation diffusion facilitator family transporter [Parcubacteria group bacterium]|nr:cation diffusion facilitator family transporter [Parcubacteria group bacterium]
MKPNKAIAGTTSVIFALGGNACITVLKFIGYFLSGSSSLFSEAVHSLADTMNQSLLLIGLRSSTRVADEEYAYGYGNERFLWALISACGIFFLGAGVTVYHGISSLLSHHEAELSTTIFAILITAFVIESFTLYKAAQELRLHNKEKTFVEALEHGDPVTIAVVYEDTAAVLGVIVALCSVTLSYFTHNYLWDAVGSIIVGLILAVIAVFLIKKNREFLIGKSIPEELAEQITEMLVAEPYIEKVIDFKSEVLDIGKYRIKCEIEFNGAALIKEVFDRGDLEGEYEIIKDDYEEFKRFIAYQTNHIPRLVGRKIDEVEKKIIAAVPSVKYIDIEIN